MPDSHVEHHPALDVLTQGLDAMDRRTIQQALSTLVMVARSSKDRTTLGLVGNRALFRLASVDLTDVPPGMDVSALGIWLTEVAEDLLRAGAFLNGNDARRWDGDGETWVSPLLQAVRHHHWSLVQLFLEHGASPTLAFPELEPLVLGFQAEPLRAALAPLAAGLPPEGQAVLRSVLGTFLDRMTEVEDCQLQDQARAAVVAQVLLDARGPQDSADRTVLNHWLLNAVRNGNWQLAAVLAQQGANLLTTIPEDGDRVIDRLTDAPPDVAMGLLQRMPPEGVPHQMVRSVLTTTNGWSDDHRLAMIDHLVAQGHTLPTDTDMLLTVAKLNLPHCGERLLDAGALLHGSARKELVFTQRAATTDGHGVTTNRFSRLSRPQFMVDRAIQDGYGALHAAAHNGADAMAAMLLRRGLPVNVVNETGVTALHLAAQYGQSAGMVHLLVQAGLSIDQPDAKGRTPMDWAKRGSVAQAALLHVQEQRTLRQTIEANEPSHGLGDNARARL